MTTHTYWTHNTDHMFSTYSPITILDLTTSIQNTQHWPHVQYIYSRIAILDANTHIWNTHHWPHVQYVQSYHFISSQHPHMEHTTLTTCPVRTVLSLYGTHDTDHMSGMYIPYDDRYIRSQQPHMEHKTQTTYAVRSFQSLCLIIPPTYITNKTDHMSSMYSPITILDPNTHIRNTQHWPHVQYVQSLRWSLH